MHFFQVFLSRELISMAMKSQKHELNMMIRSTKRNKFTKRFFSNQFQYPNIMHELTLWTKDMEFLKPCRRQTRPFIIHIYSLINRTALAYCMQDLILLFDIKKFTLRFTLELTSKFLRKINLKNCLKDKLSCSLHTLNLLKL